MTWLFSQWIAEYVVTNGNSTEHYAAWFSVYVPWWEYDGEGYWYNSVGQIDDYTQNEEITSDVTNINCHA